jgi:hypothetical protein
MTDINIATLTGRLVRDPNLRNCNGGTLMGYLKGRTKLPAMLRELAGVADNTLAFLYGGPDQQPGDYERNQLRTADIRADFTAFCEQRNWAFANWRQAWVAFMGAQPALQPAPQPTFVPIEFPLPAPAQPIPLWRQRMRSRYAA